MPAIRGLCKSFEAPAAPPHVYAGVSSILTIPAPIEQDVDDGHIERLRSMGVEALVVAVYILVRTRMSGVETDSRGYLAQRDKALTVLREFRSKEGSAVVLDPVNVDEWMRETRRGHWLEMDWFENIEPGAGVSVEAQGDNNAFRDSEVEGDEDFIASKHRFDAYTTEQTFLQPGLGTMVRLLLLSHNWS